MHRPTAMRLGAAFLFISAAALVMPGCANNDSGNTAASPAAAQAASVSPEATQNPGSKSTVLFEGPITGFGSVIINGVRFNDNSAEIKDDDDRSLARSDLRIGAMVNVEGATESTSDGTAVRISIKPAVRGLVDAIDTVNNVLLVLGQRIQIDSSTVSEGISTSAPLQIGDWVEVHGLSGNGSIAATLIERRTDKLQTALRGVVRNLNTAARTFNIDSLSVSYAGALVSPESVELRDGAQVLIRGKSGALAGQWSADRVRIADVGAQQQGAAEFVEFKGIVETIADASGQITVSGVPVAPANADVIPKGGYAPGQRVQVRGQYANAVLIAERIKAENPGVTPGSERNRLLGTATNRVGKDFSVNGVAVDASAAAVEGGTLDDVGAGTYVEVHGSTRSSDSGTVVQAHRVRIGKHPGNDPTASTRNTQKFYGAVYEFVTASQFKVNGVSIDARSARFGKGDSSQLADDQYIEVKGTMQGEILIASEVEFSRPRSSGLSNSGLSNSRLSSASGHRPRNDTQR